MRSVKLFRTVFLISVSYVYINYVLRNYWAGVSHFWMCFILVGIADVCKLVCTSINKARYDVSTLLMLRVQVFWFVMLSNGVIDS